MGQLEEICDIKIHKKMNCIDVVRRIKLDYYDISNKSEAFDVHTKKDKRAILDIVGNIASDLFGVLDSRFETMYQNDLSNIHVNEEYLHKLYKKQTSVIETTLNIVKKEEADIHRQHSFLNELARNMSQISGHDEQFQFFLIAAMQLSNEISRISKLEALLLDSVTNYNEQRISLNLIPIEQLKKQIDIMQRHIEKGLLIPEENIYNVMRMRPLLSKDNVLFEIRIPLVKITKFKLFKNFPTPFETGSVYVMVQNILPYIISDDEFRHYQMVDERMIDECVPYNREIIICHGPYQLSTASA